MKHPPRRWLLVTQYYPPEIGAPQIRLRNIVRELRRLGIDVQVLTAMPNYPLGRIFPQYRRTLFRDESIDDVPVRRVWLYAASGRSSLQRLLNYLSFTLAALPVAVLGPRYDVVFIEGQPLSLGMVGLGMKWLRGIPFIFNIPDLQVDAARQLGFIGRESLLKTAAWMERFVMGQAWKVSTVTHRFVEILQARGCEPGKVTLLPNGADTHFLRSLPPSARLLRRWDLEGKQVFLYVGTHAYYHSLDTIVGAARILQDQDRIRFLLIGEGPERSRTVELVRKLGLSNVVFGQSPYQEMPDLYSIACASIATLRDLPVAHGMRLSKIFPSLSCGVPVIYSGRGEAAELIQEHDCGVTVEPQNPEALARAVLALSVEAPRRRRMGLAGRRLVEQEYGWDGIVGRWLGELQV